MKKTVLLLITTVLTTTLSSALAQDKVPVSVQSAKALIFYPVKSAPAKVVPLNHASIPARITGIVEELAFKVGDEVEQDQVIASLDCQDQELTLTQLNHEVEQQRQALAFNRRELKRAQQLESQNALNQAELDRKQTDAVIAQSQLNSLKARQRQQKLNVERCQIKSPFDGLLTARLVNLGEQVTMGQPVAQLLQHRSLEVSAQLAVIDLSDFSTASQYWFETANLEYPLTLRSQLAMVENDSNSLETRFNFKQKMAHSGATGRVKWRSPTPYLPGYLLQKRNNRYGFFVVEQTRAKFITVENVHEGSPIPLQRNSQYQVFIDGRYGLTDNQPLEIKPSPPATTTQ